MSNAQSDEALKPVAQQLTDSPQRIMPKRLHPDSWVTRLVNLEIGETESRSTKISAESCTWENVNRELDKLRSSLSSVISKCRKRLPEGQWSMASGEFRAANGDLVVTVAVTRFA